MIGVITGDIINSRSSENIDDWYSVLKNTLSVFGGEGENWEIYRGDSFQIEVDPNKAFLAAVYIKASMRTVKNIDVRMAIGIGTKNYKAQKVTSSNGEAFIHSGEKFEELYKTKQTLGLRTSNVQFNRDMNLFIKLANIAMDSWSPTTAEFVKFRLDNIHLSQLDLAEHFKVTQAAISQRNSRSYLSEIMEVNDVFKLKIQSLIAKGTWDS